jgi:fluoride ion exporter CrcB/FEX
MTLLTVGRLALADSYALTSVVAALVAVWCGMKAARAAAALPARLRERGGDE